MHLVIAGPYEVLYTTAVDIWSFGYLLLNMLIGKCGPLKQRGVSIYSSELAMYRYVCVCVKHFMTLMFCRRLLCCCLLRTNLMLNHFTTRLLRSVLLKSLCSYIL